MRLYCIFCMICVSERAVVGNDPSAVAVVTIEVAADEEVVMCVSMLRWWRRW